MPENVGMYSPKSLSITPYNTTLEGSILSSQCASHSGAVADARQEQCLTVATSNPIGVDYQAQSEHPDVNHQYYQAAVFDYAALDAHRDMSMSTTTATEFYTPCLHTNHSSPKVPERGVDAHGRNEPRGRGNVDLSDNPFSSLAYNVRPLLAPSLDVTSSTLVEEILTEPGSKDEVNIRTSLRSVMESHPVSQPLQSLDFSSGGNHPEISATAEMRGRAITVQKQCMAGQAGASSSGVVDSVAGEPRGSSASTSEEDDPRNTHYRISHSDTTPPAFPSQLQQRYVRASELIPTPTADFTGSQLEQVQVGFTTPKLHYQALSSSSPLTDDSPFQFSSNTENTFHQIAVARPVPPPTLNQCSVRQSHGTPPLAPAPCSTPSTATPFATRDNNGDLLLEPLTLVMSPEQGQNYSSGEDGSESGEGGDGAPAAHIFGALSSSPPRTSPTQVHN